MAETQTVQEFYGRQSFFLHHSPNPDIEIGSAIRATSTTSRQVTAADAIPGFSYAWDAQTGVKDSVLNQVSRRTSIGSDVLDDGPRPHTVYLTTAAEDLVYPDINVVGSAARAIKGEGTQTVLDKISIPVNLSDEEAMSHVQRMVDAAAVPRLSEHEMVAKNYSYAISNRGNIALRDFEEAQGQRYLDLQTPTIQRWLDKVQAGEITSDELGSFKEDVSALSEGPESFRKLKIGQAAEQLTEPLGTPGDIVRSGMFKSMSGRDVNLQAAISSVKGTSAENLIGKELKDIPLNSIQKGLVESFTIRKSRISKPLLSGARDTAQAVALGNKGSSILRNSAAALNLLKARF